MVLRNGHWSHLINIIDEEGDLSDICYLRRLCSLILPKISSKNQRLLMVVMIEGLRYTPRSMSYMARCVMIGK